MRNLIRIPASYCRLSMILLLVCLQFTSHAQGNESMKASLLQVAANGSTVLLDGNYTQYDNIYSDAVDWDDAWKLSNFGANFGILRNNITLVIERRKIIGATDTTHFKMWNLAQGNYQLEVVVTNCNHPNLHAVVMDDYLNEKTLVNLNGTTVVNFSITADPHSSISDRFRLVYYTRRPMVPIRFYDFDAFRSQGGIQLDWATQDEVTMENYIVEHSVDGINFTENQSVKPFNIGNYKYTVMDDHPSSSDNYYRIKGINNGGLIQYSNIIKIPASTKPDISIYPNPITNKTVNLQTMNLAPGKYNVALIYPGGVMQQLKSIEVTEAQGYEQIYLPKQLNPGIYRLRVSGLDNTVITKTITVL